MAIFRNVVFVAAIAGLFAGLVMTALQTYATVPLILEAETFEAAGSSAAMDHHHEGEVAEHSHHHGGDAWTPADGFERNAYTALANVVTGIGFALLLVAVSELTGGIANWRQGIFWGFAGFATFTLAPGLGLPPELPGMPAADLGARQVWWLATVVATGAGLAMLALRRSMPLALLGIALIVAPHIIGAPQPASHETSVPVELHHRFVVAVTLTSLVFWLALGAMAGSLRGRFFAGAAEPRSGLA